MKSKFGSIKDFVIKFIQKCNIQDIPINGPCIQMIARKYASIKNIENFKPSKGWLFKLLYKNNFLSREIFGEQGEAYYNATREFVTQFKNIKRQYESKNIFNCDKNGLFWRVLPNNTFIQNVDSPRGKKTSKERLTILFIVCMEDEKLKTLIIGKSKSPKSLKNKNVNVFNIKYDNNHTSWMTKEIFYNFFTQINDDMII